MMKFGKEDITALEAQLEAQKIAYAPIIFQVVRTMRELGILKLLNDKKELTLNEISKMCSVSEYGLRVLLESALSASVVSEDNSKYSLTKIGYFLQNDKMTKINMDFNHFVNYRGLYDLDKSIKENRPVGLKNFGEWDTIYPALSSLPSDAKKAWFDFDHFYSDLAFPDAIRVLKGFNPKKILDIGGNTGRFSIEFAKNSKETKLTILDLPTQIEMAKKNIKDNNLEERIDFYPLDLLDHAQEIPKGYDTIWMSQFIDCFGEEDIIKILKRVKKSMDKNSKLYILEPLWDRQKYETSSYCIINTSPYFTALANGNSKMFNSNELFGYIKKANLEIKESIDNLGISHTLIVIGV